MSLRQVGEESVMYFKMNEEKVPKKMKKKKEKSLTCLKRLKRYAACLRLSAAGGVSSPLSIG